ncbi:hypothetical protein [Sphingomonas sp. Leaf205]|uniref:hypothetical protein n=1 Tax=Sphingomonas sp. Leaf205 TaxID=2876551 RepID=UPI001E5E5DD6|nr:hypothetical protein [Sphingomonas sp. Leaf205]
MMIVTDNLLHQSDVLDFSAPDKWVSSRSRWHDLVWRLDTNDPGYSRDGIAVRWWPGRGTDEEPNPAELAIIDDMKRLAWLGLFYPELTFVKKVTGLPSIASGCAGLLRFMVAHDVTDFSGLTPEKVAEFVEWTARDIGQREDVESGRILIKKSAFQRLVPLVYIWKARKRLQAAGVAVPAVDPLEGGSVLKIITTISDWVIKALPPVPEEAFMRIVNAAANIVLVHSQDVLAVQEIWIEHTGGFGNEVSRARANRALAAYQFKTVGQSKTPWPRDLLDPMINPDVGAPSIGLRRMIVTLRDACVIVILATAGLRIREVVAIPGGRTIDAARPDCMASETSADGLLETFTVTSSLTKGQILPLKTSWLLGSRPTGIGRLPMAPRALDVLETLMAPWRARAVDEEARSAMMVLLCKSGMPREGRYVRRLTVPALTASIYDFYRIFADLKSLPDVSKDMAGTDLRSIKESDGRCIFLRQYRKNYAQYLLRIDSDLLPAIRTQLHHMRLSTTQTGYTSNDPSLLGGPDDEQRLKGASAFAAILGEDHATGGRLAQIVRSYRRGQAETKTVSEIVATVDELGLALIPGEHGWCGIEFAPHLSRCNAKTGRANFLNIRPDPRHRNPSTCGGCPVFAFDRSHQAFWQKQYTVNRDIWKAAQAQKVEADYKVAEDRMKRAAAFLEKMKKGGRS